MSVLIKSAKMPNDCRECVSAHYHDFTERTWCYLADRILAEGRRTLNFDGRPDWCPLTEQKPGRWIEDENQIHVEKTYHCSECGHAAWGKRELTRYCPDCGAEMVADVEGAEE